MPVNCKICNKEFNSLITSTHLKTHGITTAEYKAKYGKEAISSPEYRQKRSMSNRGKNNPNYRNTWSDKQKNNLSKNNSGNTPWNKGKCSSEYTEEYKESIANGIAKREHKYRTGELTRHVNNYSKETRQKISDAVSEYAGKNRDKIKQRAQKSVETKRLRGYDFGSNMRGKHHSAEARRKISETSTKTAQRKKEESHRRILKLLEDKELEIISNMDKDVVTVYCKMCESTFTRTKQYFTPSKFKDELCPVCYPRDVLVSESEQELADFIRSIYQGTVNTSDRHTLGNKKEIDIFLPELNIGIEYNGLYWHSELQLLKAGQQVKKDFEKYKTAQRNGIRLIQIYEDEWKFKKDIVKSRLLSILGKSKQRIYARKTIVKEISSKEANQFIKRHHIQGTGRSNIRYGLYYNNDLVSVMTFSKSNVSRKVNKWEIDRFCTIQEANVVGGANKLFSKFIKEYDPEIVVSYSDNRWNTGKVYEHLGMVKEKETVPGYWYFYGSQCERIHRFSLRKNKNDDPELTEWENRVRQGYNRIWDCGHTLWIYRR